MIRRFDNHGLPMRGIKRASGETKHLTGYFSGLYVQISYDTSTGQILTDNHCSLGCNSWTVYHDPAIIHVGFACQPMTMQQIADRINEAWLDRRAGYLASREEK